MQILIFHVHRICSPAQFTLIKAASELGARLWVPEIDNMDEYLAQLKIAVANLLDTFDAIYEAFNGVFRLCSIYSNRLAPSRDISHKFASMDRIIPRSDGSRLAVQCKRCCTVIQSSSVISDGYHRCRLFPGKSCLFLRTKNRMMTHLPRKVCGNLARLLSHRAETKLHWDLGSFP
ncbi:hypothetical protein B0H14DRAFT_2733203 [Mycena olivaceomarginata]|nr:hypothetical protein B0H14DRAFT_2733203 [Mycena olivaceomarginata]